MARNFGGATYIEPMNRREFTTKMMSAAMAPAMPVRAIGTGAGAGAASVATAAASADHMYFVSWYIARLQQTCSARSLAAELDLSADVARDVFDRLIASNTVSAPNAAGVSQTRDPLANSLRHLAHGAVPGGGVPPAGGADAPARGHMRDWLRDQMESAAGPSPDAPPEAGCDHPHATQGHALTPYMGMWQVRIYTLWRAVRIRLKNNYWMKCLLNVQHERSICDLKTAVLRVQEFFFNAPYRTRSPRRDLM
jgi:hypothetical protein